MIKKSSKTKIFEFFFNKVSVTLRNNNRIRHET